MTGASLLTPQEIERVVAPFTGKGKDFGDIQRALEAVEQAYRSRGYGAVQVLLPEQDITRGTVRLQVLEPRVGRVTIEGNRFFDTDNVRRSLPSIKEGETPNSIAMSRNLQLLNEHPVKQTNVLLRAGATEDQVDVNVKVTDDKPWRVFFTLDNTGTGETGYLRSGVGFQHSNALYNRDHVFTAQYITSPTQVDRVKIFGLGYRIPFYSLNSSLDLIAGYSDVDSGTVQGLFNVTGSGVIGGARWNYYMPRWVTFDLEQKLSFGIDYRSFKNEVLVGNTNIVPDITIHPISLTYSALRRFPTAELSFYGAVSTNIPSLFGGNDGRGEDFHGPKPGFPNGARAFANENYLILRYGMSYVRALQNQWQVRVALNGQNTKDSLVPGEQFGLGGPDSVRGYLVREVANDSGYQGQLELYTPDVAPKLGLGDSNRLRLLTFFDFGAVQRNNPLPGEADHAAIRSFGLGMRFNHGKNLSVRVDFAQIVAPTLNRSSDSQRVTAAAALIF